MYFECRVNVPDCSPSFEEAKNAFLKGNVILARDLVLERQRRAQWNRPEDALLCADISRACANNLEFCATIKIAFKRWPESWLMKTAWANVLTVQPYVLRALALLEVLFSQSVNAEKALIASHIAVTYARGGFLSSAVTWIEKSEKLDQEDDPRVYYNLAYAANCNREWEKSLHFGNKALQLSPFWPRLRLMIADILLANGEIQKAKQLLEEGVQAGYRDASNEFILGIQAFTTGKMEEASDRCRRFHQDWPFTKGLAKAALFLLAHSLWNSGRYDEATEVASTSGLEIFKERAAHFSSTIKNRKIIPTPLVSQERNLCVPTAATIVAAAQGVQLKPRELYRRMRGRDGTFIWRMAEELTHRGFYVQSIKSTPQALMGMLDYGIPLVPAQK
jgi:tetratricopeptide (TPR) repeat protein